MLSNRCPLVCVCDDGVLCPNGWLDQDATLYGGSLGPGHIVLDGDPAPPHGKGHGHSSPPTFRPTLLWHGRPSQLLLSTFSFYSCIRDKVGGIARFCAYMVAPKRGHYI